MSKLFRDKRSKDYRQFKKWIEALRSGEYSQTKGTLQDHEGYCCLGVACKVLNPSHRRKIGSNTLEGYMPSYLDKDPKWLVRINVNFNKKIERQFDLPELNDDKDFSFDEIADVLEAVYVHEVLDEKEI